MESAIGNLLEFFQEISMNHTSLPLQAFTTNIYLKKVVTSSPPPLFTNLKNLRIKLCETSHLPNKYTFFL